jgi:hypothetical protein
VSGHAVGPDGLRSRHQESALAPIKYRPGLRESGTHYNLPPKSETPALGGSSLEERRGERGRRTRLCGHGRRGLPRSGTTRPGPCGTGPPRNAGCTRTRESLRSR